jgi:phospholipid transport system substrate-binding protein
MRTRRHSGILTIASVQQVLVDPKLADPQSALSEKPLSRFSTNSLILNVAACIRANARRYSDRLTEFTPLFIALLEQAYGQIRGERQCKDSISKRLLMIDVEVDTKTRLKDGSEYSVNYKLTFTPGGWRAYDVVVEGVSLVNNYRSQFDRLLSKKSFDELLQVLREKKNNFG